jgi:transcriptional regulator with XRE-family HTH domain
MPETMGARSDLAAALTILRQLRGMRQDQLAAAAGVSSALLKKIEQGRRRARPGTLRAILRALGVEAATLDEMVALVGKVRRNGPAAAARGSEMTAPEACPTSRDLAALEDLLRAHLEAAGRPGAVAPRSAGPRGGGTAS